MRTNVKVFLTIISLITITLPFLAGWFPFITREEAEKELVAFMLDSIVQKPDGEPANYVQTSGQPWLNAPPSAVLIIYAPPNEKKDKDPWEQLKVDQPIKLW